MTRKDASFVALGVCIIVLLQMVYTLMLVDKLNAILKAVTR